VAERNPRRQLAARIALATAAAATLATCVLIVWARLTFLDPGHVLAVLDDARAHEYLRERGLPGWLDGRMRELGYDDAAQRHFAGQVLRDVISEDALRDRSAMILDAVLPYATGETEQLTIRPGLDEWMLAVPDALARQSFPSWLVDAVLLPKLEQAATELRREPLTMPLTPDDTREIAHEIAPPAWVEGQVVGATYTVARWAVGAQRTFEIRIDYTDRVPRATAAIERLFRGSAVEGVLLDRVVVPAAVQALEQVEPFAQLGVERAHVRDAIERLAPAGWLSAQVSAAIEAFGAWLSGRADVFELVIDTGVLRDTATSVVSSVARETLGDAVTDEMLEALSDTVHAFVPVTTTWTETELRAAIGDDAHDELRWIRAAILEGFRYDQEDLRRELRERVGLADERIDDVRAVLGEGFVYTEHDLRAARLGLPLETVLSSVADASAWAPAPFIVAGALLLTLAFLSGPGAWPRLRWTLGAIGAAGLLTLLVLAPVGSAHIDAHVLDWVPGAADSDAALAFGQRLRTALGASVDRLYWIGGALVFCGGAPFAVAWAVARRKRC